MTDFVIEKFSFALLRTQSSITCHMKMKNGHQQPLQRQRFELNFRQRYEAIISSIAPSLPNTNTHKWQAQTKEIISRTT